MSQGALTWLCAALFLALGLPFGAEAQEVRPPQMQEQDRDPRDGISLSIMPDVTWTNWDDDLGLDNSTLIGGTLSIGFGRFVDLQGYYRREANSTLEAINADEIDFIDENIDEQALDVASYGGQVVFSLGEGDFVPILLGGGGIYSFQPDAADDVRRLKLNFGAGFRATLADWLRGEVTVEGQRFRLGEFALTAFPDDVVVPDLNDDEMRTNLSVRAGLGFQLGGIAGPAPIRATDQAIEEQRLTDIGIAIEPFVGVINFAGATGLDNQEHIGARVGADFGPFFGVRGFYWHGLESGFDGFESVRGWGGEAQFNLSDRENITPFLVAGGGQIDFGTDFEVPEGIQSPSDQTALIVGGGLDFNLGERVRLSAAVRDYITGGDDFAGEENLEDVASPDDLLHNFQYTGAVKFLVGGGGGFRGAAGPRAEAAPVMDPRMEDMDWRQEEIDRRARELLEEAELTDEEREERLERLERIREDDLELREELRDERPDPDLRDDELREELRQEFQEELREAVQEGLREALQEEDLREELRESVSDGLRESLQEDEELREELRDAVRDGLREAFQEDEELREELRDAVRDGLREALQDDDVREQLRGVIPEEMREGPRDGRRPDEDWLREQRLDPEAMQEARDRDREELREMLEQVIQGAEMRDGPGVDAEELRELVRDAVEDAELMQRLQNVATREDLRGLEERLSRNLEEVLRRTLEEERPIRQEERALPPAEPPQPTPDPQEMPPEEEREVPPAERPEETPEEVPEEVEDWIQPRPEADEEPLIENGVDVQEVAEDFQLSQFRPYAGFAVNDPTQAVIGLTADLGPVTRGSNWHVIPEIAIGFGEGPTSFMAVANLEYQVPWVFQQENFRFDPLVGVGAGLLNHDDLGAVLNLFYGGILHLTGDGQQPGDGLSLFLAHQGVDIFSNNRILAGLSFGATTPRTAGPR